MAFCSTLLEDIALHIVAGIGAEIILEFIPIFENEDLSNSELYKKLVTEINKKEIDLIQGDINGIIQNLKTYLAYTKLTAQKVDELSGKLDKDIATLEIERFAILGLSTYLVAVCMRLSLINELKIMYKDDSEKLKKLNKDFKEYVEEKVKIGWTNYCRLLELRESKITYKYTSYSVPNGHYGAIITVEYFRYLDKWNGDKKRFDIRGTETRETAEQKCIDKKEETLSGFIDELGEPMKIFITWCGGDLNYFYKIITGIDFKKAGKLLKRLIKNFFEKLNINMN